MHAEPGIHLLGTVVAPVDIEANAADAGVDLRKLAEMAKEGAEHAVSAVRRQHVNRLDPEEKTFRQSLHSEVAISWPTTLPSISAT